MVHSVCGLTRGHMMSPRSDTANTWDYPGHFLNGPSFTELLETAKLRYLKVGVGDIAVVIEEYLYLAVPFQSGYGIN
jgi:hypothetical protein